MGLYLELKLLPYFELAFNNGKEGIDAPMYKIKVAVPVPTDKSFLYLCSQLPQPGVRVKVPFGERLLIGVVLGEAEAAENKGMKLKEVDEIIDETPLLSPRLRALAEWMSSYYLHPLGEVFKVMFPASRTKSLRETYSLKGNPPLLSQDFVTHIFAHRASVTKQTLRKKLRGWPGPDGEILFGELLKMGVVTLSSETLLAAKSATLPAEQLVPGVSQIPSLNEEQAKLVERIVLGFSDLRKPFLLRGVTGSGKTRVYLSLIERVKKHFGADVQTLLLVPEIALTPQATQIFEESFPRQVALVHSALTDSQRWAELMRIHTGSAQILIGPRSAVFAPFRRLKLVIVDEEHDASYKQSAGLCYSGRDIAVVRARLEDAVCLLGSATPSLESFHNARTGKYQLLELSARAVAVPMPKVTLLPCPKISSKESLEEELDDNVFLSEEVISALRENLQRGKQAIVLVNRRGYAYYLLAGDHQPVQCPHCSVSLTVHRNKTKLLCHYCGFQTAVREVLNGNPGAKFTAVGVGSQKAERVLCKALPEARIARMDSDVVASRRKLLAILSAFRKRTLDILVGTQILAKGHDFPKVAITVVSEFDRTMDFPDFRAGERAFQLMVQAAGRAGRSGEQGEVFLQSNKGMHPLIRDALQHDFTNFASRELAKRQSFGFPPFVHMIRIELSCEDLAKLEQACLRILDWERNYFADNRGLLLDLKVLGPTPPPIERINQKSRRVLLASSKRFARVHEFARQFLANFEHRLKGVKIQVDVDPQSLM
ncbi:MAG: primosomal protein N' [Deltaproteobacteria bacterium]|nr:primosomal protein N' [Deltaproteobacteria bacterium]